MAKVDKIFKKIVREIMEDGYDNSGEKVRTVYSDGKPAYTKSITNVFIEYDTSEIPLITLKKTYWKTALREMLTFFIHRTMDKEKMKEIGSYNIWKEWLEDREDAGNIYGNALAEKVYTGSTGEKMDQVEYLINQIKNNPNSRRHMTMMFNVKDVEGSALFPCVYQTLWSVKNGKLNLHLMQRSADILIGYPFNVIQYYFLFAMIAQVTGLEMGKYTHYINDAHIYDRHFQVAEEIINAKEYEVAKFKLDSDVTDFFSFEEKHFEIVDYESGKFHKLEIAI